jgi:hypothetical protein
MSLMQHPRQYEGRTNVGNDAGSASGVRGTEGPADISSGWAMVWGKAT